MTDTDDDQPNYQLSETELRVLEKIKRNKARLVELGLADATSQPKAAPKKKKAAAKIAVASKKNPARSTRNTAAAIYTGDGAVATSTGDEGKGEGDDDDATSKGDDDDAFDSDDDDDEAAGDDAKPCQAETSSELRSRKRTTITKKTTTTTANKKSKTTKDGTIMKSNAFGDFRGMNPNGHFNGQHVDKVGLLQQAILKIIQNLVKYQEKYDCSELDVRFQTGYRLSEDGNTVSVKGNGFQTTTIETLLLVLNQMGGTSNSRMKSFIQSLNSRGFTHHPSNKERKIGSRGGGRPGWYNGPLFRFYHEDFHINMRETEWIERPSGRSKKSATDEDIPEEFKNDP